MRKCPKCGGEHFKAIIRRGAIVNVNDDLSVEILREGVNSFELVHESMTCANKECGHVMTFEELTAKTPCVSCGELYEDGDLSEGKCELCLIKEKFASATKDDLFRLILELKHKAGPQELKIEKKLEKAEETEKKLEEKEEEKEEDPKPAPKKKRKSPKKKTEEAAEEEVEEVEETEETEPAEETVEETVQTEPEAVIPEVAEPKEEIVTPESAEAKDVSNKPQQEPVTNLTDIFGNVETPDLSEDTDESDSPEAPVDFVF